MQECQMKFKFKFCEIQFELIFGIYLFDFVPITQIGAYLQIWNCSLEGVWAYWGYFLFNSLLVNRQFCPKMYTPTPTQFSKTHGQQRRLNFHEYCARITHVPKTWFLCGLHPMGSFPHTLKTLFYEMNDHMSFIIHINPTS